MRKFPQKRIIGRLDIKGPNVIKGMQFEGLRVVGCPNTIAKRYYDQGVDELLYIDTVASLYSRDNLFEVVSRTCENVHIPITVGGGLRSLYDIECALSSGADKVCLNTAAMENMQILREAAVEFGSQCIVLSIEAMARTRGVWEAYRNYGRDSSGIDVVEWVQRASDCGIGEILVTSINRDGTKKGYDLELFNAVRRVTDLPLIVSGGAGKENDILNAFDLANADAVAVGAAFHFGDIQLPSVRSAAINAGFQLRPVGL
ncbi:imidazole glycerol phosphate synthase cyclase subunit [Paracoccaceae bacterium]|nr:imidazole glycerol phosphate synthase cyclase subunit [Paracoccaceae bacterium]